MNRAAVRPLVVSQAASVFGTQVTVLALPTVAVLSLGATPVQAALIFALEYGAQGLIGPLLGVLVDRVRARRRLLMATDAIHALLVLTVPVAHWCGVLSLPIVFAVAATSGVLGGLTMVGIQATIPRLVAEEHLVAANSAVTAARSVGQIAGPAAAGWLVQVLGAAVAMVVDAASYLVSIMALRWLRPRPEAPGAVPARTGVWRSLREGFAALRGHPVLVRITISAAALNLGGAAVGGLFAVYAYRHLRLSPLELGVTFATYSAAAVVGVATATRVIGRLGPERVVPFFAPVLGVALLLVPAAAFAPPLPTLLVYEATFGYCATVWTIATTSLQQRLVPPERLGRVLALSRSVGVLLIPVGALAGGVLAQTWGMVPTLTLFALTALIGATIAAVRRGGPDGLGDDRTRYRGSDRPQAHRRRRRSRLPRGWRRRDDPQRR